MDKARITWFFLPCHPFSLEQSASALKLWEIVTKESLGSVHLPYVVSVKRNVSEIHWKIHLGNKGRPW